MRGGGGSAGHRGLLLGASQSPQSSTSPRFFRHEKHPLIVDGLVDVVVFRGRWRRRSSSCWSQQQLQGIGINLGSPRVESFREQQQRLQEAVAPQLRRVGTRRRWERDPRGVLLPSNRALVDEAATAAATGGGKRATATCLALLPDRRLVAGDRIAPSSAAASTTTLAARYAKRRRSGRGLDDDGAVFVQQLHPRTDATDSLRK